MAYCYAELAVSPLTVAMTIASTRCTDLWMDGQTDLMWVVD